MSTIKVSAMSEELTPAASDMLMLLTDEVTGYVSRRTSVSSLGAAITGLQPPPVLRHGLNLIIGHGMAVITTGIKGYIQIPYNCEIEAARLLARETGNLVVDIWRDTYANFPPVVGDSICSTAKPTLSSANRSENTTLTGWTRTLATGDILAFNVDSAATITLATLVLVVRRT